MLQNKIIFVFGSNEAGMHGAGAANIALKHHGAIYYQGFGIQGLSYAIPTKDKKIDRLSLKEINKYVDDFLLHAEKNYNNLFYLTPIGCGLAGFTPEEIAPMFMSAPINVMLPKLFRDEFFPNETQPRVLIYGGRNFGIAPEVPEHLLKEKFKDRDYSPRSVDFTRKYYKRKMFEACLVCERIIMGIGRKKNTTLISGLAEGADQIPVIMKDMFPKDYGELLEFPANWLLEGKRAGPLRNKKMLDKGEPNFAIGFPGGRGTTHMKKLLDDAKIPNVMIEDTQAWLDRFETLRIGK